MAVKAKLEGHAFDLDALVELFREGEPKVGKEEDGYYLASARGRRVSRLGRSVRTATDQGQDAARRGAANLTP